MKLKLKETISKILAWIHEPFLHNSVLNTNTYYRARRDDTGTEAAFGVGSGGVNHGVWSDKLGKWLIYGNAENVYVNQNVPMFVQSTYVLLSSYTNTNYLYLYKFGKMVVYIIGGSHVNLPNGGYHSLGATVPSGYRPAVGNVYCRQVASAGNASGASILLRIEASGAVSAYNYSGAVYNGNAYYQGCYVTNE